MELAGRENASTCRPASFLTRNTKHNTSGPGQCDSGDTSTGKESCNGKRTKKVSEINSGGDLE